jgi:hypothetical protein
VLAHDLQALLRPHPTDAGLYGLVAATKLLVVLQPGERTWRDVTRNPYRRVGRPCDEADHGASSNCDNAYIFVDAIDPDEVPDAAAARSADARWIEQAGYVRLGLLRLTMTDRAQLGAGPRAALRLFDLRADPEAPTLTGLHLAGARPGAAEWMALNEIRKHHNLVGFLVRSSHLGATVIFNLHALKLLLDAGLISDVIGHEPVKLSGLQRLQRWTDLHEFVIEQCVRVLRDQAELAQAAHAWARAWIGTRDESSSDQRTSISKRRVVSVVAALAAIVGLLSKTFGLL